MELERKFADFQCCFIADLNLEDFRVVTTNTLVLELTRMVLFTSCLQTRCSTNYTRR